MSIRIRLYVREGWGREEGKRRSGGRMGKEGSKRRLE